MKHTALVALVFTVPLTICSTVSQSVPTAALARANDTPASASANLVQNGDFTAGDAATKTPVYYTLTGNARWAFVGYADEMVTPGIKLSAYRDGGSAEGSVEQIVTGIDPKKGKWLRFTFRGLPEENFTLNNDRLSMKIAFYAKNGTQYRDAAERLIYREVTKERAELGINGRQGKGGAAVWRTYEFEELLPFPDVDTVHISVNVKGGTAKSAAEADFFVDDFALTQSNRSVTGRVDPADRVRPAVNPKTPPSTEGLIALGGRWYYQPNAEEASLKNANGKLNGTLRVTEANADRLFYRDDRLINPFAGSMTAILRKGFLDRNRQRVTEERFVPDNVTLTFDGSGTVRVTARNIPNHPTAKFPDTYGTQGYNPSYIQEQDDTYYLPLDPQPNPKAVAMTERNANGGLPMGPIGFAVNGVVFYNPFDAGMTDATDFMDRCCGHPSPDNRYHYHKYPICVNTPFVEKGERHSPLIGFAFDGFPVYGPYESSGVMAKDLKENALNAFNIHRDAVRGWHYHVTPGKYPYLLGGYYGNVEMRNFRRRF